MPSETAGNKTFLQLKEAPWLITKDIEEQIRKEARQKNKSVGELFREKLKS